MQTIHIYQKSRDEQLGTEIAAATRIPLADVRQYLAEISKKGDTSRARKSKECWPGAGYIPTPSPGRKLKPKA